MDQKGQASVDLIFATVLLLVLLPSLTNIVSNGMDTAQSAEFAKAKVVADNITRAIDSVYTNGEGQYEVVTLPGDFIYKVNVVGNGTNSVVNVIYKGKTATSSLIPQGRVQPVTMNPNETYNITNTNGQITFTKK